MTMIFGLLVFFFCTWETSLVCSNHLVLHYTQTIVWQKLEEYDRK